MAVDFTNMENMFLKSQETMAKITELTTEHKMIMSQLEAIKNAFQAIKG